MLEPASSNAGFLGMALMIFLLGFFFLLRAWCLTEVIWKIFNRQRD